MKREFRFLLLFLCSILVSTSFLIGIIPNHNAQNQSLEDEEIASLAWALEGVGVVMEPESQDEHQICTDGAGGVIIVYRDNRGPYSDIYAQRINSSGDVLWGPNGTVICTAYEYQMKPQICSDGYNGAVITWMDRRTGIAGTIYDIYAQRINSTGHIKWDVNGTCLCNATDSQDVPDICSDLNGSAIVTWRDARGSDSDIYVQRINATGHILWADNGVRLFNGTGYEWEPKILYDGQKGAFVTWRYQNGSNHHIFAQHVDSSGQIVWSFNETVICNISGLHSNPKICSDGDGGMIVVWQDGREVSNTDIYAQRITSDGIKLWGANGTAICTANDWQNFPDIVKFTNNSAIITWSDSRSGNSDIYAQYVNSSGYPQWGYNGMAICTANGDQVYQCLCTDGNGDVIISWEDKRDSPSLSSNIYAQRINSSGQIQWSNDGHPITKAPLSQNEPRICCDGGTGAYIVWKDLKINGIYYDLFAQYIDNLPNSTHPADVVTSAGASHVITWSIYDDALSGKYRVWANNSEGFYYIWKNWTTWNDSTSFNIDINRTAPGIFEYILEYYDNELYVFGINDTVIVNITDGLPHSTHPADITTSTVDWDDIEWRLYDDFDVSHFRVWANDTTGQQRLWLDWAPCSNNTPINVPINRMSLGTFNYTIEFNSSTNQIAFDSVLVTITEPISGSGPPDLTLIVGILGALLVGSVVFTVALYLRLNKKVKELLKTHPTPKKSLPKTK